MKTKMENQEDKLFKPDFEKSLFTITIDVKENCAMIGVAPHGDYKPTYHEVMGALETQKIGLIFQQRELNIRESKKVKPTVKKTK